MALTGKVKGEDDREAILVPKNFSDTMQSLVASHDQHCALMGFHLSQVTKQSSDET